MEGTMEEYKANLRAYHLREHIEHRQRKQMAHITHHQLDETIRKLHESIKNHDHSIKKLRGDIRELNKKLYTRPRNLEEEIKMLEEITTVKGSMTEDVRRMKPVPSDEGLKSYKGKSPRRFKHYVKDRCSKAIRAKYNFPETEYQDAYGLWVGYD
uniref:Uncharacterized protein n=1 Tax=Cacopsylla melanoneura TaxID=428564 RepID=A0A8D9EC12_9HEMI